MLKFQKNCTIENLSYEDFILLIFVLTDDFYKSVALKFRPNAICRELIGIDSEKVWFKNCERNFQSAFFSSTSMSSPSGNLNSFIGAFSGLSLSSTLLNFPRERFTSIS